MFAPDKQAVCAHIWGFAAAFWNPVHLPHSIPCGRFFHDILFSARVIPLKTAQFGTDGLPFYGLETITGMKEPGFMNFLTHYNVVE